MDDVPSSSSSAETSMSTPVAGHDPYLRHKLTKLDTLAGLAIRYNVTVSDIKRANGLLTDTGMFARDTLLIPTRQLPVGEEVQVMFASIMSGYGRDPSLNPGTKKHPGTSAVARMQGVASDSLSLCDTAGSRDDNDDEDVGTPYSKRSHASSDAGDVELMERHVATEFIPQSQGNWASERVRRRRNQAETEPHGYVSEGNSPTARGVNWHPNAWQGMGFPEPAPAASSQASGAPLFSWSQLTNLSKTINESALVQKIRRAASQPALAAPAYHSFGDAADAIMNSISNCAGNPGTEGFSRGPKAAGAPHSFPKQKHDMKKE